MILNNRIIREFFENKVKYLGLMFLIILSSALIVGFAGSTDNVITTGKTASEINNVEDGDFICNSQLNNLTIQDLKNLGVSINENFYTDYELNNSKKIRIFKNRTDINKISIIKGTNFSTNDFNSIIMDSNFALANGYSINSTIILNNKIYTVIGYGATPDYSMIKEKSSDLVPSPQSFGIGFISENNFSDFSNITYSYTYKSNGISDDKIRNILSRNTSLVEFTKAIDNPRIRGYIDDSQINKNISIIVGITLFLMIAFMISTTIVSNIDKESAIIGTLYSLGYVKKQLIYHFMILPIILVFIGGIIGTILGFYMEEFLSASITDTYSLPNISVVYSPYLFLVGIIIPTFITAVVNYYVLSKRLNSTPLQLLRKEKKQNSLSAIRISGFKFITKFRLRQFLRELNSSIVLFIGIFISIFLLVLGIGINSTINNYLKEIKNTSTANHTYILKLPIEIPQNENTEKITYVSLSYYFKSLGQDLDVSLQGINENSNFFKFHLKDGDEGVYISEHLGNKFNLKTGDLITLKDTSENKLYNLRITGTVDYPSGLYIFMNRSALNKLLDKSNSYFNGYLSTNELNINKDYLFSHITTSNIIESASNTTDSMMPLIIMLIIFSSILFIVCTYLLLKLNIDKNALSISLVKVFGFKKNEISKLYMGSSLYIVALSTIISIPLCVQLLKIIYPNLILNVPFFMNVHLQISDYLFMITIVFLSYFISSLFLKKHINKISLAESLKNRD